MEPDQLHALTNVIRNVLRLAAGAKMTCIATCPARVREGAVNELCHAAEELLQFCSQPVQTG